MEGRPLWAPWRIDYIKASKPDECIFCAAAAASDDAEAHVVDRGEHCLTMLNAFPYAAGHVMVAPSRHIADLDALAQVEAAELMTLTQRALGALRTTVEPDGFNVGLNLGKVAGAGFDDHLHLHVVPRWLGDTNFMPVVADTHVIPEALDVTAAALSAAIARLRP
jgi:ATP adenylyltransferase